jgi:hypothetical protein
MYHKTNLRVGAKSIYYIEGKANVVGVGNYINFKICRQCLWAPSPSPQPLHQQGGGGYQIM